MTVTIAGTSFDQHEYDERDGALTVTVPPDRVVAAKIEPALIAA